MNPHILIVLILAAFELLLGIYVFIRYEKSTAIKALTTFLLSFSLMSFVVSAIPFVDEESQLLMGKLAFVAGISVFSSLLILALHYPIPSVVIRQKIWLLWMVPFVAFTLYILAFDRVIEQVRVVNGLPEIKVGDGFWVVILFVVVFFLLTMVTLVKKLHVVIGEQRRQMKQFIVVLGASALFGILVNFILPMFGIHPNSMLGLEGGGLIALFVASIVMKR